MGCKAWLLRLSEAAEAALLWLALRELAALRSAGLLAALPPQTEVF